MTEFAASGSVPVIWGDVPPRIKNFTGRKEILDRLRPSASSNITAVLPGDPLPTALRGLGGVGKTAIGIEYAYQYRSDYDVVWWIRSEQLPLVRSSLAALAQRLGLEAAKFAGIEGAAAAALDALRRGEPYRRWLLIFDNADRPEDFREYIPSGSGHVLITSRNPAWHAHAETVQVDVFSRPESVEFLRKRAPTQVTSRDADLLAEKLGDLPLALDQAGAVLYESGMPVEEYIDLLDQRIVKIMDEGRSAEYPMSVTAAWEISVDKVRQQLPEAQELLRSCAFFGPDPIPRDVFRRGTQATGTVMTDLMEDSILMARAIRELGRYALVTIDGRAISVHRLVQALLRDELSDEQQARYRRDVHAIMLAAAPTDPGDTKQWPRYEELLPHLTSEATAAARSTDKELHRFVLDMMRYLYLSGDHTSCLTLTKEFIDQWTLDSGPDDPSVLGARRHYCDALRQLGRYTEAFEYTESTLIAARAAVGERDRLTLVLRNGFAGDLRARGDFAAALRLDEETRQFNEEVFGPNAPETLRALSNLAADYGLNSEHSKARELCQRAFRLQSAAPTGVSASEVLISWVTLAWAVRMQGRYTEARDVGEEAWDFGKERLGPDHFATLRAAIGLSIALRRTAPTRQDVLQTAFEVHEQCRKRFGEKHPDTMAAAISLTNAQRVNGMVGEAFALAEQTVDRYPDVYGANHPYSYGCQGNLALMRRVTGDLAGARQLNERALSSLDAQLGRDHYYSLTVAVNLASDLAMLGETAAARSLSEDTLTRLTSLLGEKHALTLGCAANLALDRRADGATAEADLLSADTIKSLEATLGAKHPDTTVAGENRRLDPDFDPPPV
jgi:tetratricopeptide (TPR) repeat protein